MKEYINIVICDDEKAMVDLISERCKDILAYTKYSGRITSFLNGEDLLTQCEDIDIAILDIEMPNIDGFTLAEKINHKYKDSVKIIFLTSHYEPVRQAFHVNAFRYLIKSMENDEFKEAILQAIEELLHMEYVLINNREESHLIRRDEITHIESMGDGSVLYTEIQNITNSNSIKYWTTQLEDTNFICIHRSYIVNLQFVKNYKDGIILLRNGICLPVSIRKRKLTKESIFHFIKTKAKRK